MIESLTTAFSITILQAKCKDGVTYLPANIAIPTFGPSAPGTALAADGSTEIYEVEDFGDNSVKMYPVAATFNLICGEATISDKAGGPSWFTVS